MAENTLYTIGYGHRTTDQFIELLNKYRIKFLIDLRSKPFSKFNSQFSKKPLEILLNSKRIKYIFMGDSIGGIPLDTSCYTEEGKADYKKISQKEFYRKGINRLSLAYSKNIPTALMCAESKPQDCHRTKLIGVTLSKINIELQHIDESGLIQTQTQVIETLLGDQMSFFNEDVF